MPYMTPTGYTYDSGEFEAVLEEALELADWDGFEGRRISSQARGFQRGIGICLYIDDAGILDERMDIRFDASGGVTVLAGTMSTGTGHETAYAQMICDWLGVPFEKIRVLQGDTDRVAVGRGTYASRSMVVGGNALRRAADAIIEKGKLIASHLMEVSACDIEFKDGNFSISGTDRELNISEVAYAASRPMMVPVDLGVGLNETGGFVVSQSSFPNGCHICEIEVDPETGSRNIVSYAIVDDFGVIINPMIVQGQVHGGVAQGIGEALFEEFVYDQSTGQLLSGSFMDYCMPRADDLPSFDVAFHNVPCTSNPIGVKGAGEGGTVGSMPAVVSALLDALRPLGVENIKMPATPMRIWEAIQDANDSSVT
jgi:carbon-monoxide dehydrogenase large subunit